MQERCGISRGLQRVTKPSDRERWQETNNTVIVALAEQLSLQPEWVSDMLYGMTLKRFQQLMLSKKAYWMGCRVPFVTFDTCDYYTMIFDAMMNLIFPMEPNALLKLIELLRGLDEKRKQPQDNGLELLFGKKKGKRKKKRKYPWIGPDSNARDMGRRRRFGEDYSEFFAKKDQGIKAKTKTHKDQGMKTKIKTHHPKDPLGEYAQFMDRMRRKTVESNDMSYAKAIKELQSIPMQMAHIDETPRGKRSHTISRGHSHANLSKHHRSFRPIYYYGEQVPILAHAPFDPEKPETWIRRHPHSMRLADRDGTIVQDKPLQRYKRVSIRKKLVEARKRISVRSEYTPGSSLTNSLDDTKHNPISLHKIRSSKKIRKSKSKHI